MKWMVYAVFDVASGVYDRPFVAHGDPAAHRSFGDVAVSADHPIGKHPQDFTLFRIGTYDDNSGHIDPEPPAKVVTGLECVAQAQKVSPGSLQEEVVLKEVN